MIKISTAEKIIFSFLLFIAAMLLLRIVYAGSLRYIFLMWNLFLAWIPFEVSGIIATGAYRNKWIKYFLFCIWLLFFPNSLYIVTDLVHLEETGGKVPVWFDVMLLFASSVTGLIMAFVSLHTIEQYLSNGLKTRQVNIVVIAVLFLGSFGVYLGRFLRWNSWDIVANPVSLLMEVASRFAYPLVHYRTWIVTLLLTFFFSLLYFAAKQLPLLLHPGGIKNNMQGINLQK